MHYTIPIHAIDSCGSFRISDPEAFRELARHRTNADLVLNYLKREIGDSSPVMVWPHHFDTGMVINAYRNGDGEITRTIGTGYAIPDRYCNQPYFYFTYWSKDQIKPPYGDIQLDDGKTNTKDWYGGILPAGELTDKKNPVEQKDMVVGFLQQGIDHMAEIINARDIYTRNQ
jgi:hypothetical protein